MKRHPIDWPAVATRLGQLIPRERLHPEVLIWANGRPARERWAVALSGGADSTALLLLLWAHWPEKRQRLLVLHFDHRLRGKASRDDALFCQSVCSGLGVVFVGGHWSRPPKAPSEAVARTERFEFFQRELGRRRISVLWLGQQQDDIAETLLMRLARGSGTAGLAAPRPIHFLPKNRIHLRPMLSLKKEAIQTGLISAGANWREDATNQEGTFFRNRVRNDVLSVWREASKRDAVAGAALSRELLAEDDDALRHWLDRLFPDGIKPSLDLKRFAGVPRAIVRRALHRWLAAQPRPVEISKQGFERLLTATELGRDTRQSLGRLLFARIRKGVLEAQKAR